MLTSSHLICFSFEFVKMRSLLGFCCLLSCIEYLFAWNNANYQCDIVLRRSNIVQGLSVISTRDFERGQVIEQYITPISFYSPKYDTSIIDFYSYGYYPNNVTDYIALVLGHSMLLNHNENQNVQVEVSNKFNHRLNELNNEVLEFQMIALRNIIAGEELFSSYGDEQWFNDRNMQYKPVPSINTIPLNDLMNIHDPAYIPGCPHKYTEIYNGRVYAKQRIPANTVIEVDRALIFEHDLFENTSVNAFIWRSLVKSESMLVLGNGALYRGRSDEEVSNVRYDWYSEVLLPNTNMNTNTNSPDSSSTTSSNSNTIISNILCTSTMLIQFTATRDINVHEELILDLYKVALFDEVADEQSDSVMNINKEISFVYRYAKFNSNSDCF